MQIKKYLENTQPIIYKTYSNALKNNQLSHAYLISGTPGTPLLEVAKYLAKSILCDDPNPFACDNCITCARIESNNYPDFYIFDGSKETIKKEVVANIENSFEMKAFEAKGIRVYILHLIENMTTTAVNSLLKFLEEPGSQIYAFLTTNNENSVLPTIISRCQLLRLKLTDRNAVIQEATNFGIDEKSAELLSFFYNSGELIKDKLDDDDFNKSFEKTKESIELFLDVLTCNNKNRIQYEIDKNILPILKGKEETRLFLDVMSDIFENMLSIKHGNLPYLKSYATILEQLSKCLNNLDHILLEILKCRNILNLNVNSSLAIDHVIYSITKEQL